MSSRSLNDAESRRRAKQSARDKKLAASAAAAKPARRTGDAVSSKVPRRPAVDVHPHVHHHGYLSCGGFSKDVPAAVHIAGRQSVPYVTVTAPYTFVYGIDGGHKAIFVQCTQASLFGGFFGVVTNGSDPLLTDFKPSTSTFQAYPVAGNAVGILCGGLLYSGSDPRAIGNPGATPGNEQTPYQFCGGGDAITVSIAYNGVGTIYTLGADQHPNIGRRAISDFHGGADDGGFPTITDNGDPWTSYHIPANARMSDLKRYCIPAVMQGSTPTGSRSIFIPCALTQHGWQTSQSGVIGDNTFPTASCSGELYGSLKNASNVLIIENNSSAGTYMQICIRGTRTFHIVANSPTNPFYGMITMSTANTPPTSHRGTGGQIGVGDDMRSAMVDSVRKQITSSPGVSGSAYANAMALHAAANAPTEPASTAVALVSQQRPGFFSSIWNGIKEGAGDVARGAMTLAANYGWKAAKSMATRAPTVITEVAEAAPLLLM